MPTTGDVDDHAERRERETRSSGRRHRPAWSWWMTPAPTPQPSPGPGKDNTAPALLAKADALKRGVLRVRFSCNEACFVRASVQLGRKTVGKATDSSGRGGTGTLRIRLKGAGRTARHSKLTLRLTARDRAGNTRSLSLPLGGTQRACGRRRPRV